MARVVILLSLLRESLLHEVASGQWPALRMRYVNLVDLGTEMLALRLLPSKLAKRRRRVEVMPDRASAKLLLKRLF